MWEEMKKHNLLPKGQFFHLTEFYHHRRMTVLKILQTKHEGWQILTFNDCLHCNYGMVYFLDHTMILDVEFTLKQALNKPNIALIITEQ